MLRLFEAKREIRRLSGDEVSEVFEDSYVYEVLDDESQEGTYYLVIDRDLTAVTLTSITSQGDANQGDMMLLATRVTCCEPIVAENGYIFEGDVAKILDELIDQHAVIVLNDIDNAPLDDNPDALPLTIPDLFGPADRNDEPAGDDEEPIQMPDVGADAPSGRMTPAAQSQRAPMR